MFVNFYFTNIWAFQERTISFRKLGKSGHSPLNLILKIWHYRTFLISVNMDILSLKTFALAFVLENFQKKLFNQKKKAPDREYPTPAPFLKLANHCGMWVLIFYCEKVRHFSKYTVISARVFGFHSIIQQVDLQKRTHALEIFNMQVQLSLS